MKSRSLALFKSGLIAALDLTTWTGAQEETIRVTTRRNENEQDVRIQIRDLLGIVIERPRNLRFTDQHNPAASDEVRVLGRFRNN